MHSVTSFIISKQWQQLPKISLLLVNYLMTIDVSANLNLLNIIQFFISVHIDKLFLMSKINDKHCFRVKREGHLKNTSI